MPWLDDDSVPNKKSLSKTSRTSKMYDDCLLIGCGGRRKKATVESFNKAEKEKILKQLKRKAIKFSGKIKDKIEINHLDIINLSQ